MQELAFVIASPERFALIVLGIYLLGVLTGSEYISSKLLKVNNPNHNKG